MPDDTNDGSSQMSLDPFTSFIYPSKVRMFLPECMCVCLLVCSVGKIAHAHYTEKKNKNL